MPLAYVFWHWPAHASGYVERLQAFHDALGEPDSVTYRLQRAPWDHAGHDPYEDWYPVADWAALGELNERAVSGASQEPHDAAAQAAGTGMAGVYRLVHEGVPLREVTFAAWFSKPFGRRYGEFDREVEAAVAGQRASVWQRQLVLGPAPEYAVLATSPLDLPWEPTLTEPRVVAGAGAPG